MQTITGDYINESDFIIADVATDLDGLNHTGVLGMVDQPVNIVELSKDCGADFLSGLLALLDAPEVTGKLVISEDELEALVATAEAMIASQDNEAAHAA